jgi:hypothetical protein
MPPLDDVLDALEMYDWRGILGWTPPLAPDPASGGVEISPTEFPPPLERLAFSHSLPSEWQPTNWSVLAGPNQALDE